MVDSRLPKRKCHSCGQHLFQLKDFLLGIEGFRSLDNHLKQLLVVGIERFQAKRVRQHSLSILAVLILARVSSILESSTVDAGREGWFACLGRLRIEYTLLPCNDCADVIAV